MQSYFKSTNVKQFFFFLIKVFKCTSEIYYPSKNAFLLQLEQLAQDSEPLVLAKIEQINLVLKIKSH